MNRALPEMLHCFNNTPESCTDNMTVLERQRARMKLQQEQLQHQQQQKNHDGYYSIGSAEFGTTLFSVHVDQAGEVSDFQNFLGYGGDSFSPGRVLDNGCPELGKLEIRNMGFGSGSGRFELNPEISRNSMEVKETESKTSSAIGKDSFKKRKQPDNKLHNPKVSGEDDCKAKRMKVSTEEGESKITDQNSTKNNSTTTNNNRETSGETSKENSKASEVQKPDYIHVRARRGQATDSHSLAERVRREKISERMKYLQDLVPGCNKITGKAGMLDEIINYVQSLQRQVEFLSMKLAAMNPSLDFDVDDLFAKEVFSSCTPNFTAIGEVTTEMANPGAAYLQLNQANHMVSLCGLNMGLINPSDLGLRRTINAPLSLPESFVDLSCFTPGLAWNGDVQDVYNAAFDPERSTTTTFHSQPYTDSIEASNLKMEM